MIYDNYDYKTIIAYYDRVINSRKSDKYNFFINLIIN